MTGDTVKVRRFEPGATGDPALLKPYLLAKGYKLTSARAGRHYVLTKAGQRGRPRTLSERGLLDFVDELRVADGLEPLNPMNAKGTDNHA